MKEMPLCWIAGFVVCFSGLVLSDSITGAPRGGTTSAPSLSAFMIGIKIINRIYNDSLTDLQSAQYQALRGEVEDVFSSTYSYTPSLEYQRISDMTFSNGSVIATSTAVFASKQINEQLIKNIFVNTYREHPSLVLDLNISYTSDQEPTPVTLPLEQDESITDTTSTTKDPSTHSLAHTSIETTSHSSAHTSTDTTSHSSAHTSTETTSHFSVHTSTETKSHSSAHTSTETTPQSSTHSSTETTPHSSAHSSTHTTPHSSAHTSTHTSTITSSHSSIDQTSHTSTGDAVSRHIVSSHPPSSHTSPKSSDSSSSTSRTASPLSSSTSTATSHHSTSPGEHVSEKPSGPSGSSTDHSTQSTSGSNGAGSAAEQGVPGWGVALLVLAAIILFFLLLLFILLLLCWCCWWRRRGFMNVSDPDPPGYYNPEIPMYSTHSTFDTHNGKTPDSDMEKPPKNRTGMYVVNP